MSSPHERHSTQHLRGRGVSGRTAEPAYFETVVWCSAGGVRRTTPRPPDLLDIQLTRAEFRDFRHTGPPVCPGCRLPRSPVSVLYSTVRRRSGSGWRQGRVRWGRPLLIRPREAVGSGPAAVESAAGAAVSAVVVRADKRVVCLMCLDGCEVRRCDPCALVRPRVPCVSRVCPGTPRFFLPVRTSEEFSEGVSASRCEWRMWLLYGQSWRAPAATASLRSGGLATSSRGCYVAQAFILSSRRRRKGCAVLPLAALIGLSLSSCRREPSLTRIS